MPAYIVMHNTARSIQLKPVESFVSKSRIKRLGSAHPLVAEVDRAMRVLFMPIRAEFRRMTLKELWDAAAGHPALERCAFLPENGQFPSRIIVKDA